MANAPVKISFTFPGFWDVEAGKVFANVLEHAGVYKRTFVGRKAFLRFLNGIY